MFSTALGSGSRPPWRTHGGTGAKCRLRFWLEERTLRPRCSKRIAARRSVLADSEPHSFYPTSHLRALEKFSCRGHPRAQGNPSCQSARPCGWLAKDAASRDAASPQGRGAAAGTELDRAAGLEPAPDGLGTRPGATATAWRFQHVSGATLNTSSARQKAPPLKLVRCRGSAAPARPTRAFIRRSLAGASSCLSCLRLLCPTLSHGIGCRPPTGSGLFSALTGASLPPALWLWLSAEDP